jgi:hypothetical protein
LGSSRLVLFAFPSPHPFSLLGIGRPSSSHLPPCCPHLAPCAGWCRLVVPLLLARSPIS